MWSNETLEVSRYRATMAGKCLKSAELLFQNGDYQAAANRAYYAVFHAMRSLLILVGEDFRKHSGVIGRFRQLYIKTGVLPEDLSLIITNLSRMRNECDYGDLVTVSANEVLEKMDDARRFCQVIGEYRKSQIGEDETDVQS
ncbi:MAG: HEPN domain-containing protein [Planctomycetia bacterium]|nr:HEPN domain-containing protein [Planctomycetia bacterium]